MSTVLCRLLIVHCREIKSTSVQHFQLYFASKKYHRYDDDVYVHVHTYELDVYENCSYFEQKLSKRNGNNFLFLFNAIVCLTATLELQLTLAYS